VLSMILSERGETLSVADVAVSLRPPSSIRSGHDDHLRFRRGGATSHRRSTASVRPSFVIQHASHRRCRASSYARPAGLSATDRRDQTSRRQSESRDWRISGFLPRRSPACLRIRRESAGKAACIRGVASYFGTSLNPTPTWKAVTEARGGCEGLTAGEQYDGVRQSAARITATCVAIAMSALRAPLGSPVGLTRIASGSALAMLRLANRTRRCRENGVNVCVAGKLL